MPEFPSTPPHEKDKARQRYKIYAVISRRRISGVGETTKPHTWHINITTNSRCVSSDSLFLRCPLRHPSLRCITTLFIALSLHRRSSLTFPRPSPILYPRACTPTPSCRNFLRVSLTARRGPGRMTAAIWLNGP